MPPLLDEAVSLLLGVMLVTYGAYAVARPDRVRQFWPKHQVFQRSRKALEPPTHNAVFRVMGVIFILCGGWLLAT